MNPIKSLNLFRGLGRKIRELEYRTIALESLHENEARVDEEKILEFLVNPATITEISEKIDRHRAWVSLVLNRLKKRGVVKETGKAHEELRFVRVYT